MPKILDVGRWVALFSKNWINPFATLLFNFYYLPFSQAIKFPIWFYGRPRFLALKGYVRLEPKTYRIKAGMIKFNATKHTPYPTIPFEYVNDGGTIIFCGSASIDCGARLHVFGGGQLIIGANVRATGVTLAAQEKIELQDNVWVGNGSVIYDTDFHYFLNKNDNSVTKSFKPVVIEHDVSIFTECYIGKGVKIPHHCIVSSRTTLFSKPFRCQPYSIISGNPGEIMAENYEHLRLTAEEEKKFSDEFKSGKHKIEFKAHNDNSDN